MRYTPERGLAVLSGDCAAKTLGLPVSPEMEVTKRMTEIGPVQMIAVAFGADAQLEGRIIDELAKLESERTIRILDLLFVHKDAETGDLLALDHQGESLGAIVGALLGSSSMESRSSWRPRGRLTAPSG